MLDESMAGLTPTEAAEASQMIRSLRDEGPALIVVEHVMEYIMPIARLGHSAGFRYKNC